MVEMAKAYKAMANAPGGPQGPMQFLVLRDNTYEKLARANAEAINGLQPKISVWNTGSQAEDAADPTAPIRNLFQGLPPLLETIDEQTGIKPPN
jgi:flotillin